MLPAQAQPIHLPTSATPRGDEYSNTSFFLFGGENPMNALYLFVGSAIIALTVIPKAIRDQHQYF